MADAVLLLRDIHAGIFPARCVRTGKETVSATHEWAIPSRHADVLGAVLGAAARLVPGATRVPVPVDRRPYRVWRRRAVGWAALTWFAVGTSAMSLRNGDVALAVVGLVVLVAARLGRLRSWRGFWVAHELRRDAGHVIVRRAHPAFDDEARRLFLR